MERDVDAAALTRLVTRLVLPVGWRAGEAADDRVAHVPAGAGARDRGPRRGHAGGVGPGMSRSTCSTPNSPGRCRHRIRGRPAEVLVRVHGRPLGTVRVGGGGSVVAG